jgi:hypothetical protein
MYFDDTEKMIGRIACILVILVVVVAIVAGLKMSGAINPLLESWNDGIGDNPEGEIPKFPTYNPIITQTAPNPADNPDTSIQPESSIHFTDPILPADPYASDLHHSKPPEQTQQSSPACISHESLSFLGERAVGIRADIEKGPFIIEYSVDPTSATPAGCYLAITVRDPDTLEVIAEGGYGRTYSVERSKQITIYNAGSYHITLVGSGLDLELTFLAGA